MHDDSTLRRPRSTATRATRSRLLALTILAHPDPRRVGELAFSESAIRLSRLEPEFQGEPLADRHISRRPLKIEVTRDEVIIEVDPEVSDVRVDGRIAGGRVALPRQRLDHGIVIELSDRIAILLHQRSVPCGGPSLGLLGASDAIEHLRDEITRVADLATPVCLIGETGTGKERTAAAIHAGSGRQGPFVAINMAAVPKATAVSQLFGHARGAFTGADSAHRGAFRQAHTGTLFLDEIGECSDEVQAMLLRGLETGEIVPLGGEHRERVDVRIVAATDRDLGELVRTGTFREALWHRLAGYVIRLPALRARRDDIARLFLAFLQEELATTGEADRLSAMGDEPWLPAHVIGALCRAEWPGNVRELRNVARRIAVASRGAEGLVVDDEVALLVEMSVAEQLPNDVSLPQVLERHGWHIADTAKALGVSRTTLYARMDACPDIRKPRELSSAELTQSIDELGRDLDTLARHFRVSRRGLQLRLRELGL